MLANVCACENGNGYEFKYRYAAYLHGSRTEMALVWVKLRQTKLKWERTNNENKKRWEESRISSS